VELSGLWGEVAWFDVHGEDELILCSGKMFVPWHSFLSRRDISSTTGSLWVVVAARAHGIHRPQQKERVLAVVQHERTRTNTVGGRVSPAVPKEVATKEQ
jgi:hypothetical protein